MLNRLQDVFKSFQCRIKEKLLLERHTQTSGLHAAHPSRILRSGEKVACVRILSVRD